MEYCLWICVPKVAAKGGEDHLNRPEETLIPSEQRLLIQRNYEETRKLSLRPFYYRPLTLATPRSRGTLYMKKILLALLASTAVGGVAAAQSFPDVPSDSYAAEAVSRLADLGIVIGFPDGTFRGNEAFTRYQAALVVSRLLDTVQGEMLTSADLDTLRNAVQELASDVAANQQSVQDLQSAISSSQGADPAAVEQLQSQLDALTVELDTLNAAQAAAAGLEQQVQSNTDQISQLGDLVGILNDDIQGATSGQTDTSFLDDITQNTSDIANLREFVVLLRRNQAGLTERVATIEESDTAQNGRLDDVETRVTALEQAGLAFSGSIGLKYQLSRLSGAGVPFDVDRIFGVGAKREQPSTIFSGDFATASDDLNDDSDQKDPGEVPQDRQDIDFSTGDFQPELTLNINFSQSRGIAPESGLNSFDSSVALELRKSQILKDGVDIDAGTVADDGNYYTGYAFEFKSFEATLGPIGADPINFYYGEKPGASFTDYVFESIGPGFRVDIGTPEFLAFLQPTLQIAYGSYASGGDVQDDTLELPNNSKTTLSLDGAPVANPFTDAYYRGIHGTLTPFSGEGFSATGGFSVAQLSGNAADNADAATALDPRFPGVGPNANITVYGLNGDINLSILNVTFEYAQNNTGAGVYFQNGNKYLNGDASGDTDYVDFAGAPLDSADRIPTAIDRSNTSETLFYSELTVDTEAAGIPLLRELTANYRNIPQYWYGIKYDKDTYPWKTDQEGYGASATVGLSIFNLTGFYDHYTIAEPATEPGLGPNAPAVMGRVVDAYGVELGATLYRAVEVYGFYNVVTLDGQAVQLLDTADRNSAYVAGLGVGVRQDGQAEDALLPGIDFDVAYSFTAEEISAATVNAETTIAGITLSPYVNQKVDNIYLPNSDDVVSLEAGTGISTEPLDVLLQPSFAANINYRNADHTDVAVDTAPYTANSLQYSVGINFNQFLLENSTLGVRYGSYTGTNIQINPNVNGSDDFASDISDGDTPGTGTQTTSGYEVVYNYYGLQFGYGAYVSDTNGDAAGGATGGQAFSILYTVNF